MRLRSSEGIEVGREVLCMVCMISISSVPYVGICGAV